MSREPLKTIQQAFVEIDHARRNPGWFTRGESAAWQQTSLWLERGEKAVAALLEETKDYNG